MPESDRQWHESFKPHFTNSGKMLYKTSRGGDTSWLETTLARDHNSTLVLGQHKDQKVSRKKPEQVRQLTFCRLTTLRPLSHRARSSLLSIWCHGSSTRRFHSHVCCLNSMMPISQSSMCTDSRMSYSMTMKTTSHMALPSHCRKSSKTEFEKTACDNSSSVISPRTSTRRSTP